MAKRQFLILCPDDGVCMEDHEEGCCGTNLVDEYVLNDVGKIWMGSYGSARGREWIYGQFDDAALPVCVYLLERCGLSHAERGDPVLVSRALTKMVYISLRVHDISICRGGSSFLPPPSRFCRPTIDPPTFNSFWPIFMLTHFFTV